MKKLYYLLLLLGVFFGWTASANAQCVSISTPETSICDGETITLTADIITDDCGFTEYSILWSTGGTTSSILVSPNVTTTYSVTITDTGGGGGSDLASLEIVVNPNPSIGFSGDTEYCVGSNLQLEAFGGDTYSWSGPDSFSSNTAEINILNVTAINAGNYDVTVTNSTTGCSSDGTRLVIINSNPSINFSGDSEYCVGSDLQLEAFGGDTYSWSGPDSFSSNTAEINILNVTASNAGNYDVTVANSTTGCSSDGTNLVVINSNPSIGFSGDSEYCVGSDLQLEAFGGDTYSWSGPDSFSSNTAEINILNLTAINAGNYDVTVTNSTTGCSSDGTRLVIINANPTISFSGDSEYCVGNNLQLEAFGGDTYSWSGPDSFSSNTAEINILNVTAINAGNYDVTVANSTTGCSSDGTRLVNINTNPTISFSGDSEYCIGNSLQLEVSGGDDYSWEGPNSFVSTNAQININNLTTFNAGIYNVTVTNSTTTCFSEGNNLVVVNSNPDFTFDGEINYCEGEDIELVASGGDTYSWTGPDGFTDNDPDITINNVDSDNGGTYSVTITNTTTTCVTVGDILVSINSSPEISFVGESDYCIGDEMSIEAVAGVGTYTWQYDNVIIGNNAILTIPNVDLTDAGEYTVEVTIAGCGSGSEVGTDDIVISINQLPQVTSLDSEYNLCEGNDLEITANDGTSFEWTYEVDPMVIDNTSSLSFEGEASEAGEYHVLVTNNDGCFVNVDVELFINDNPIININGIDSYCIGDDASIEADGGVGYEWFFNSGSVGNNAELNIAGIMSNQGGIYTVNVVNNLDCESTETYSITVNDIPVITGLDPSYTVCAESPFNISAEGGVDYAWTYGASTQTISSVGALSILSVTEDDHEGTYHVLVSNDGCTSTADVELIINPLPVIILNPMPDIVLNNTYNFCVNDDLSITASGGDEYLWLNNNQGAISNIGELSITDLITNDAGQYSVEVTNSLQCVRTQYITVNVSVLPDITTLDQNYILCENEQFNISANGGTEFNWYFNSGQDPINTTSLLFIQNVTVLDQGTYRVDVENFGCISSFETELTVNPLPIISLSPLEINDTYSFCTGESLSIQANTNVGSSYEWSFNNVFYNSSPLLSINNLELNNAGDYTITATSIELCSSEIEVTVTVNQLPNIVFTTNGYTKCENESFVISADGADEYIWELNDEVINFGSGLNIPFVETDNAGVYTVTGSNPGCASSEDFTLTVNPLPIISLSPSEINDTYSFCTGENLSIQANTNVGSTYEWSFNDVFYNSLPLLEINDLGLNDAGDYTVSATSTESCTSEIEVTVTVNQLPDIVFTAVNGYTICENNPFIVSVGGADNYEWEFNGSNFNFTTGITFPLVNNNQAGEYTVTGSNPGCSAAGSFNLIVNPLPVIELSPISEDYTYCSGDNILIQAVGGSFYNWSLDDFSIDSDSLYLTDVITNTGGLYTVTVTSSLACVDSLVVDITVNQTPEITEIEDLSLCFGEEFNETGQASIGDLSWNLNTGMFTPEAEIEILSITNENQGTYTYVANNQECRDSLSFDLTVNPLPIITFSDPFDSGNDYVECIEDTLSVTVNGGNTYEWSDGNTEPFETNSTYTFGPFTAANTTSYDITVTSVNDCLSDTSFNIIVNESPNIDLQSIDGPFCTGGTSVIYNIDESASTTYTWSSTDFDFTLSQDSLVSLIQLPNDTGAYYISIISTLLECESEDSMRIEVVEGGSNTLAEIFRSPINNILYYNDNPGCYQWGFIDSKAIEELFFVELDGAQSAQIHGGNNEIYQSFVAGDQYDADKVYWCKAWSKIDNPACDSPVCPSIAIYDKNYSPTSFEYEAPKFELYPNPSTGIFRVEVNNLFPDTDYQWRVINSFGQMVFTENFYNFGNKINHQLNTSELSSGMYYLGLYRNGKVEQSSVFIIQSQN